MNYEDSFPWPQGTKAAVSFTYDDGRSSQLDTAIPLLNEYGVKGTFFVSPPNVSQTPDSWRDAAAHGHELGNHTLTHPCTGHFSWIEAANALENMVLEDMRVNIASASRFVGETLGVQPRTFAYPCYQTFLGRGAKRISYVPLVAELFLAGRGGGDECSADPASVDLAHVPAITADTRTFEELRPWIDEAVEQGRWLVFVAHDVTPEPSRQAITVTELRKVVEYVLRQKEIRVGTFGKVAKLIKAGLSGARRSSHGRD